MLYPSLNLDIRLRGQADFHQSRMGNVPQGTIAVRDVYSPEIEFSDKLSVSHVERLDEVTDIRSFYPCSVNTQRQPQRIDVRQEIVHSSASIEVIHTGKDGLSYT